MNKHIETILIGLVSMVGVEAAIAHPGHVHEIEKENMVLNGIVVGGDLINFRLELPYKTMFFDEKPWLVYGIKNLGYDTLLLMNHVLGKRNTGDVQDGQMWFQFAKEHQFKWNFHPAIGRNWKRIIENESNLMPLKAGEIVVGTSRDGAFFDNSQAISYESVRAGLLVSENTYIGSNWCEISISPKSLRDGAEYLEIDYGAPEHKAPLFINQLDGEKWIFIQDSRICKVPGQQVPVFEVDKTTAIITIKFPSGQFEPVTHDVKMIRTLSGPKELIPHMYLEKEMRSTLKVENRSAVNKHSGVTSKNGNSSNEAEERDPRSNFQWLIVTVVGIAALILGTFLKSKSQKSRSRH